MVPISTMEETAMDANGLVSVRCAFSVRETTDRLVAQVTAKGLTVFARIDHGANASAVGLSLRPTELIIFGNPKAGTVLMQERQTSGIDLPVKALAWEDEAGVVWLTYNDAQWLADRHGLGAASAGTVEAIGAGLAAVSSISASRTPSSS
jgi:uncharacterized protein (DUF302 family)